MGFHLAQFLTGLASASSLFLAACGLSLVFGVTRIVNFAHGSFYMVGAYLAVTLADRWSGPLGFWGAIAAAALAAAALGAVVEILLLRRLYASPELFQLLATFGVTLVVQDAVVWIWGAEDLLGPRAPGLRGAVTLLGERVPDYDLVLIAVGPVTLGLLLLLLHRTRWGVLIRAATQDRAIVAALGVDESWLFTGVFALGCGLAALGGALQIPRVAASHAMDLSVIVEVFVVVVVGGLGSVAGAFAAAVLIAELNAFGILVLPQLSLAGAFLAMAAVLVVRPLGLLGRPQGEARLPAAQPAAPWRPLGRAGRIAACAAVAAAACLPLAGSPYALAVASEIAVAALFAASLQFLLSTAGLISFGHAAFFGLGAYGAAVAATTLGLPLPAALALGTLAAAGGGAVAGAFCVRLSGVYLAMLTLAVAQLLWSVAFAWTGVTGGDNGILGVWPTGWAAGPAPFYWLCLLLAAAVVAGLRVATFSRFGYRVRALRDAPARAATLGIRRRPVQWAAFVLSAAGAGLAGALFAFLKGSVFPDVLGVGVSVDALVAALLGGIGTVSGAVAGAAIWKALSIGVVSGTDYSRAVLGLVIVGLAVALPRGVVGTLAGRMR